jgi:EAL domain-containing protein (putative c-di-GMP-specific phosphodiesterase class I)
MTVTPATRDASIWFLAGQVAESEPIRRVTINSTPFKIGRRSELSLCLAHQCVSKEHAEIFEDNGALWIRDLGSTNGTYLNGVAVDQGSILREGDLLQFATVVFRVCRDQADTDPGTLPENACDRALAMIQFDRLINQNEVVPFFQPIVDISTQKVIGYEVLGRSRLFGLMNPQEMFSAASQLNMEAELSRAFRRQGISVAEGLPMTANLFVNTHPVELVKEGLVESLYEIRQLSPDRPITLEIHEAAVTNPDSIRELRTTLEELNIMLAYDDFGAGQARLAELAEVRPDFLKFDMKLIRGLHLASPKRQQFVASLVRMVADLGTAPLAEGVEYQQEHEACRQMGFTLGQGFLYGKPASASKYEKRTSHLDVED